MSVQTSLIFRRIVYVLAIAPLLAACSQKIDGTSLQSFADSVKSLEAKLPPDQAKELGGDLMTLMNRRALNLGQLRELTNGMDAKDVHRAAQEAETQWKAAYRADLQAKINALEAEEAKNQAELAEMAKFSVTARKPVATARLNVEHWRIDHDVALPVTIQNQTHYEIKEFGYDLTLRINGNSYTPDPWLYRLQKPLALGESVTVQITDKPWKADDGMGYALSDRMVQPIANAVESNPNADLSATIKITSITSTDGAAHSPRETPNALLAELKKELADQSR